MRKWILVSGCALCAIFAAFGDQYATTDSGARIVVRDDGTWSVAPDSGPGWSETACGAFKVERFWSESDYALVLVSYRNTTARTFATWVRFQATIYDGAGNMLDAEEDAFHSFEYGSIEPGFDGTLKMIIRCPSRNADHVVVKLISAT